MPGSGGRRAVATNSIRGIARLPGAERLDIALERVYGNREPMDAWSRGISF